MSTLESLQSRQTCPTCGACRRMPQNYVEGDVGYLQLSDGTYALCDKADFDRASSHLWAAQDGYSGTWINGGIVKLHHFILGKQRIDHCNRNIKDCRRSNLRPCTQGQNTYNTGPRKGTSKYKGVSFATREKKWKAQITFQGRNHTLGYFTVEEDAASAYNAAAKNFFGQFAYLNTL